MDANKLKKKAEELMAIVESDKTITMWELLAETSADGFTMDEVYYLCMYLDKVWYNAEHFWKGNDGELKNITPNYG